MKKQEVVAMINSLSCPVCNNLCSSQAVSCPKCGHPINTTNSKVEAETNNSGYTPLFIIIFKILAYISLVIAGWNAIYLILKPIYVGYEAIAGEPKKNIIYFIVATISYAFFSFLISVGKRKQE